jgi:hypothetical protein
VSTESDEARPSGDEPKSTLDLTRAIILAIAFVVVFLMANSGLSQADGSSPGGTSTPTTMPAVPTSTTLPAASTSTTQAAHSTTTEHAKKPNSTTTTIPKSQVKVQVANGTATAGVATQLTNTLQTAGWNTLPPVNATSSASTSVVYYAANRKWAAQEIASELKLASSAVQPLTTSVPVPGAAGDDVIVLIGPDLASS